jgi:hypothetical protein
VQCERIDSDIGERSYTKLSIIRCHNGMRAARVRPVVGERDFGSRTLLQQQLTLKKKKKKPSVARQDMKIEI